MLVQVINLSLMFGTALEWTPEVQRRWFRSVLVCIVQDIVVVEPLRLLFVFCVQRRQDKKQKPVVSKDKGVSKGHGSDGDSSHPPSQCDSVAPQLPGATGPDDERSDPSEPPDSADECEGGIVGQSAKPLTPVSVSGKAALRRVLDAMELTQHARVLRRGGIHTDKQLAAVTSPDDLPAGLPEDVKRMLVMQARRDRSTIAIRCEEDTETR